MNPLTVFFVSGRSFWFGLALLVLGAALSLREQGWISWAGARLPMVFGGFGVALSATPMPAGLSWLLAVALASLLLALHLPAEARPPRLLLALRLALVMACLAAAAAEAPHAWIPRLPAAEHRQITVIGDSITAGIGFAGERTWPEVFTAETGIPVRSLAVGGGTCASALPDAARIPADATLVLLEIGGNDILGRTSLPRFADDLDRLMAAVAAPGRTVVMLEVPAPPFHAGYIAAQRRLARQHRVVLLPRQVFASFFGWGYDTVDGLHLANSGHQRMARRLARILRLPPRENRS
jgi:acyl-CoA thioesterase-1